MEPTTTTTTKNTAPEPSVKPRQPDNLLQPYLRVVAADTLDVLERGFYFVGPRRCDIAAQSAACAVGSVHYTPQALDKLVKKKYPGSLFKNETLVEVTPETTMQAIDRLELEGFDDVFALNFASASKPGGGFLNGRTAQEEALARSSALYKALIFRQELYLVNDGGDHFYTDDMVYSPRVPFFKDDHGAYTMPYYASVLTAPAPNLFELPEAARTDAELALYYRAHKALAVALHHGHKALVLGAWGCGVFKHNPEVVSWIFKDLLDKAFKGAFEHVVFAVAGRPGNDNFYHFDRRFNPQDYIDEEPPLGDGPLT